MIKIIISMFAGAVLVKYSPVVNGWVDQLIVTLTTYFPNFFV